MLSYSLLWLAIWSTLLCCNGLLLKNILCRQAFKLAFFPAVATDGAFRALACLVTATRIKAIHPVADRKPLLVVDRTPIPHLGPALGICLRLLLLSLTVFVTLTHNSGVAETRFALPMLDETTLTTGHASWSAWSGFGHELARLPRAFTASTGLVNCALFYFLASLVLAASLSFKEYLAAIYSIVTLQLCMIALGWLGAGWGFFSRGWFLQRWYVPSIWAVFSFLVLLTALLSVAALLARAVQRLFARSESPRRSKPARDPCHRDAAET